MTTSRAIGFPLVFLGGLGVGVLVATLWMRPAVEPADAPERGATLAADRTETPSDDPLLTPPVPRDARPLPARRDADPAPTASSDDEGFMPTAPLDRHCRVQGTLVDVNGTVRAKQWCLVKFIFGTHEVVETIQTAEDGRFETSISGVIPPGVAGRFTIEPGQAPSYRIQRFIPPDSSAERDLPHPLPTGLVQLGDVHLNELPLVAGGLVISELGPVVGARVEIVVHTREAWPHSYELKTDEDGRFELRLADPGTHGTLSVQFGGWRPVGKVEFDVGAGDLLIQLNAAGDLLGKVRCARNRERALVIELVDRDGERHASPTRWFRDGGGNVDFAFRNVALGPARLTVRDPHGATRVVDVVVKEGETRDPAAANLSVE